MSSSSQNQSYANITATNALPPQDQPRPDSGLLEGQTEDSHPIKVGEAADKVDKKAGEAKDAASRKADEVSKKAKAAQDSAIKEADQANAELERKAERAADKAEDVADEAGRKAKAAGRAVRDTAEDAAERAEVEAKKAGRAIERGAKKTAQAAEDAGERIAEEAEKAGRFVKKEAKVVEGGLIKAYKYLATQISQPQVFIPLFTTINVALSFYLGYKTKEQQTLGGASFRGRPVDQRMTGGVIAGVVGLFAFEAYTASPYLGERKFKGKETGEVKDRTA